MESRRPVRPGQPTPSPTPSPSPRPTSRLLSASQASASFTDLEIIKGNRCRECHGEVRSTPSGAVCANGHGGVDEPIPDDAREPRRIEVTDPSIKWDIEAEFDVRDGDVMVISYPEITLPLPKAYSSVKIGGWIYTRRLCAGDNLRDQATKIYDFLSAHAKRTGTAKVREFANEFKSNNREG